MLVVVMVDMKVEMWAVWMAEKMVVMLVDMKGNLMAVMSVPWSAVRRVGGMEDNWVDL